MVTSSSLRMGMLRTYLRNLQLGTGLSVHGEATAAAEAETNVVLLTELLGEGGAHDGAALGRVSLEVRGSALATRGRSNCRKLLARTTLSQPSVPEENSIGEAINIYNGTHG